MQTLSLLDIIKECGGCDFLKIDIEGGEWEINPIDLRGIRRIELETHPPIPRDNYLIDYLLSNWNCTCHMKKPEKTGGYYHCTRDVTYSNKSSF